MNKSKKDFLSLSQRERYYLSSQALGAFETNTYFNMPIGYTADNGINKKLIKVLNLIDETRFKSLILLCIKFNKKYEDWKKDGRYD